MPVQTLLTINPDQLFENHSIAEIQIIQSQLQNEIEKKREDLRTMVGERYRDLLKAADTITEMKETSKSVISNIEQITHLCQELQEKRLIGFKQCNKDNSSRFFVDLEDVSKTIEIKILLSLPEQIWTALDHKEYLLAAQLYLLATHIHLGVEVSPRAKNISEKFPVLGKQWEIISSCRKIIIDGAKQELKAMDLSYKRTAECLCCLMLLEVMSYEKLIMQFLDFRMQILQHVLHTDEISNVKQKFKITVVILQQTLAALYECFLGKNEGSHSVYGVLESITGENAKPTLSKMKQVTALPDCYLSPLITDFHPKTTNKVSNLPQETIQNKLHEWLANVEKLLEIELTNLLTLIVDIKRLHKIHEEIIKLEYSSDWEIITEALSVEKKLNIYERFMICFMTKRVKELITIEWQNGVETVISRLKEIDETLRKDRGKQSEKDIRWFVWKEGKTDTEGTLKLKTQGYTSRVTELCSILDTCLLKLLNDVELYGSQDFINESKFDVKNNFIDIINFLNESSFENVKKLAENVKGSCKSREGTVNESSIILRARFLQSLNALNPNLEKCLRQTHKELIKANEDSKNNIWLQTCAFLNEESNQMWRLWKEITEVKFRTLIKEKLDSKISLRNLLASKPLSEVITIEEQTEDGTKVKSDIRVPSQPSLPLQNILFQACQHLNAVVPHTLPRSIHEDLVDTFIKDIVEHYEEWTKSDTIYQSQSWQMLLDLRFLILLFVTRENKDKSQALCENLEKMIDPFDLDVYYPYLQTSVKKSAQKLQGTLGVLINFGEKLPVFNGLKLTQNTPSQKMEEPNLLAMSNNLPWFPLLPVSSGGNRRSEANVLKESSPGKSSRIKERENKKESASSDFVRSAGAFFGAMTGGWS